MSAFGTKIVAVLDTESNFGVSLTNMRDDLDRLTAGQVSVSMTQPANPFEGQLWYDKVALKLKIYVDIGGTLQWVEV